MIIRSTTFPKVNGVKIENVNSNRKIKEQEESKVPINLNFTHESPDLLKENQDFCIFTGANEYPPTFLEDNGELKTTDQFDLEDDEFTVDMKV